MASHQFIFLLDFILFQSICFLSYLPRRASSLSLLFYQVLLLPPQLASVIAAAVSPPNHFRPRPPICSASKCNQCLLSPQLASGGLTRPRQWWMGKCHHPTLNPSTDTLLGLHELEGGHIQSLMVVGGWVDRDGEQWRHLPSLLLHPPLYSVLFCC